jgi:hypothetical protein
VANYYVDSVYGSDLNSGLSSSLPFRTLARLMQYQSGNTDTYFLDPVNGSDLNDGQTRETAWQTTVPADLVFLSSWMKISYNLADTWNLYRRPDMTMDEWTLPMNLVTNRMNNF